MGGSRIKIGDVSPKRRHSGERKASCLAEYAGNGLTRVVAVLSLYAHPWTRDRSDQALPTFHYLPAQSLTAMAHGDESKMPRALSTFCLSASLIRLRWGMSSTAAVHARATGELCSSPLPLSSLPQPSSIRFHSLREPATFSLSCLRHMTRPSGQPMASKRE